MSDKKQKNININIENSQPFQFKPIFCYATSDKELSLYREQYLTFPQEISDEFKITDILGRVVLNEEGYYLIVLNFYLLKAASFKVEVKTYDLGTFMLFKGNVKAHKSINFTSIKKLNAGTTINIIVTAEEIIGLNPFSQDGNITNIKIIKLF